ncbi:MAG: hypothetical protein ACYSW3_02235 [Planctomycetota bacterium]|jgi:hypothetical protein
MKIDNDEWVPITAEDGAEVAPGIWYEIYDYSERDYGNDWGFTLYDNGKIIKKVKGIYSSIRQAGNAARKAKKEYLKSQ